MDYSRITRHLAFLYVCIFLFYPSYASGDPSVFSDQQNTIENNPPKLIIGLLPLASSNAVQLWANLFREEGANDSAYLEFKSSASYESFIVDAISGKFDLLIAPAHIAYYLREQGRLNMIAFDKKDVESVIFVREKSAFFSLSDIANEIIVAPDPLSIVSVQADIFMKNKMGVNRSFNYMGRHNHVFSEVITGRAAAGVIAVNILNIVEEQVGTKMRVIQTFSPKSHLMMLVREDIDQEKLARAQKMVSYANTSAIPFAPFWLPIDKNRLNLYREQLEKEITYVKNHFLSVRQINTFD